MNNTRPLRITATAGTKLVRADPSYGHHPIQHKALRNFLVTYIELPDQTFVHCPIFLTAAYSSRALSQSRGGYLPSQVNKAISLGRRYRPNNMLERIYRQHLSIFNLRNKFYPGYRLHL